jgi:hygromycin-B 4-O-kinase
LPSGHTIIVIGIPREAHVPPGRDDVAAFLGCDAVEPVGHGEWSRAFYFTREGREFVARFSATDDDFLKDQHVRRMAGGTLPIPKVLEIGPAFGGYFAISERAHGGFLEERDLGGMQRLLPSLFEMLDGLRTVDLAGTDGFGLWRGSDGRAPHATWRDALLSFATHPPSTRLFDWRAALARNADAQQAFDHGYAELQTLVSVCPNERYLVHSDLLYFNVLVQSDRIASVLDWGSSLYGDFVWDLACFTFWQPWYTAWSTLDIRQAAAEHFAAIGLAVPNFDARLRCYEVAIGLDGLAYQAYAATPSENLAWTAGRLQHLLET